MALSRKHYEGLANCFLSTMNQASAYYGGTEQQRLTAKHLASSVAHFLAEDNPRFDRARFLKACGVQS